MMKYANNFIGRNNQEWLSKMNDLYDLWDKLVEAFGSRGYINMPSCNKDASRYLVPEGTEGEVTYFGKPELSFRLSDHWNWISPKKAPGVVQCKLYRVREPKLGERPLGRIEIGLYKDGEYHFIAGERRNKNTNGWLWDVPASTEELVNRAERYMTKKEA